MKYDEIINHPHYEPKRHPRMSKEMRAGQFAPFAALSGHAEAVRRTAKFAELRANYSSSVTQSLLESSESMWEGF